MIKERKLLYKKWSEERGYPVIFYKTSRRIKASGMIDPLVLDELIDQLELLPSNINEIDLIIDSNGGDPLTAWRFISILRSKVKKINVVVPYNAYSAATMIALGANKILMSKYGCLGPIDPQIKVKQEDGKDKHFAYEDVTSFLDFVKNEAKLTEQEHIKDAFQSLTEKVEPIHLGYAYRGSSLSQTLGEKLLLTHMKKVNGANKAQTIVERLNKSFFNHGHSITIKDAKEIGLSVEKLPDSLEEIAWEILTDIENELNERKPFEPVGEYLKIESNQDLLKTPKTIALPAITDQAMFNQVGNAVIQLAAKEMEKKGEPHTIINKLAILESTNLFSAFEVEYRLLVTRDANLDFIAKFVTIEQGWNKKKVK